MDIQLMPDLYSNRAVDNRYLPQDTQNHIASGQTSTVTFNNKLKRGLEVIKSSEDDFVEGVTFHLFGTSSRFARR
ncbi:MAG: hypothetical protein ACLSB9_18840 [Hydrogeniiclostridium mannosilyticum]